MKYDENEEEPLTSPDTENRTRLNASEGREPTENYGPGDYWTRLSNINTGAADSFGNHDSETARRQERQVAWDVMCGHLELTSYQKREGRRIVRDLNLGGGGLGVRLHLGVFALAAYIVQNDARSRRAYHPCRTDENNCQVFLDVADEFEFAASEVHSVLHRLDYHVPEY